MSKLKKTLLVILSTIVILITVVIIFISPIAKYLVEKYDTKYTGREITIDWAYVNPFTGYVHLDNFKAYELKSDSIFLSVNGISANLSMWKLLSKTYEISELELNKPKGMIIQNGNKHELNFTDIIEKFTPKETKKVKPPIHFSILKINITNGEFHYQENVIPIKYYIKNVNIESSGVHWNADTIAFKFSFLSGIGSGKINGDLTINSKTMDYHCAVVANKFDLKIMEQYLKDITNYGSFSAFLNADIKSKGNFKDKENINAKGMVSIDDFHFGKNPKEDYASFEKLVITINELSPKYHKYSFDSISLNHPYFKYERYDYLDNLQTMFGKKGSNIVAANANQEKFNLVIEIAKYVKVIAKNFLKSNYKINRVAIYKGDLKYNDYSLSEKFGIDLNPIYIVADSITKSQSRVSLSLKSGIKPYGNMSVNLSINPNDSSDFNIKYHVQKLPLSLFNPYVISYTAFPMDRGTISLNGIWHVRNGMIQSNNHLLLIDSRLSNKIKNKATRWIPMRVLLFFIRERGNVIDYEIPITGSLKDPKFHWKDIVFDALENIIVKPLTTPYRMEVRTAETTIEKSVSINWKLRSNALESEQEKFVKKIVDFLKENPEAHIDVYPQNYLLKEKEYILFFEAKKKYYLFTHQQNVQSFCEADSEKVNLMSVKDSMFIRHLNNHAKDPLLFTLQEKCERFVGISVINKQYKDLKKERLKTFMFFFEKEGVKNQIKIHSGNDMIPYNGFSFYKIKYKNDFPESLIHAYQKINELNNQAPRKKYKKEREKNKKNR